MPDYSRPQGIRLKHLGLKTNSTADSMPEGKSPYAQNIRAFSQNSVTTRPPIVSVFPSVGREGSVGALEPTLGVYKTGTNLVQNGVVVDHDYAAGGASLIPFRPNASPQAWEYVFDAKKSVKVNSGVVQNIGVAEPQAPVDAYVSNVFFIAAGATISMSHGGTASAASPNTRVSDFVRAYFPDPASPNLTTVQVSPTVTYTRNMLVTFSYTGAEVPVLDVFPGNPNPVTIAGIYYYSGTNGRCVIVPNLMPGGVGTEGQSIYAENFVNSIRRGAIIQIGTESLYVASVTNGPDGNICFETTTTQSHLAGQTFTILPGIQVPLPSTVTAGSITANVVNSNLGGSGIGTLTSGVPLASNLFTGANGTSFQEDDYLHFSVNITTLAALNEVKILFDVGDGSFTQNFYYYTVRAADVEAAVQNTLSQLGAAQLVEQRAIIDEEQSVSARNQGNTRSGDQTTPGDGQWSEIVFPVRALTRVGGDVTKTLQNVNAIQYLFNTNAGTNISICDVDVFGGGQVDVGDTAAPYRYWIRPRSSLTGAKGNPSPGMRYGVSPRRSNVSVVVPTTYPDPQVDTWDIFRQGGGLDQPRKVGNMMLGSALFVDNYSDDAIAQNEPLEFDNLEPFPTIASPLQASIGGITANGCGTALVVNFVAASLAAANALVLNLLPGNEIQIGQESVYTLWTRPTYVGTTAGNTFFYLVQLVENASVNAGLSFLIQEPMSGNLNFPYAWGPDVNGTLFAVGDPNRAGSVSRTKPQNPDSALDSVDDLCAPSEPLQNGVVMSGLSFVASATRWWAGTAGKDALGNLKYSWNEVPVGDGLASPYALCTDGKYVYFVTRSGIMRHSNGTGQSLTDDDLYNLFPHEGMSGVNVTYAGNTIYAPAYTLANTFRLAVVNNWLFFDYVDAGLVNRTLVMDTKTLAWQGVDTFATPVAIHAGVTIAGVNQVYLGDTSGTVLIEVQSAAISGETIAAVYCTKEEMPDVRAQQMWGDASVDLYAPGSDVTITPVFLGVPFSPPTTITGGQTTRESGLTINLNGQNLARSMGLEFAWSDLSVASILYSWQPSFVPQPEDTTNRWDDWDDCGTLGAKFIQGVIIEADTANIPKIFAVESSENGTSYPLFEMPATFNGQGAQAFSLVTPFISHLVRLIPQDNVVCRKWRAKFIYEPCPELVINWVTQGTTHGFTGYLYVQRIVFGYSAQAPVFLTIVALDGSAVQSVSVTLPSTGGQFNKIELMLPPNKGRLYTYQGQGQGPWRPYVNVCEVWAKQWGSAGPFMNKPLIGGEHGDRATI